MNINEKLEKLYKLQSIIEAKISYLETARGNPDEAMANYIIEMLSSEENIAYVLMVSPSRKREIVIVRMMCMALMKIFTSYSLVKIGSYFGNRDHATVIHAIKTVNDAIYTKSNYVKNYEQYRERIRNYRNSFTVEEGLSPERTIEEILGGETIDSILDNAERGSSGN